MLPLGLGPRALESIEEPVDLLLACHGRIRHFSQVAVRLAGATESPLQDVADAAASLERYFSIALPLHERDEQDSLAPRLLESNARGAFVDALSRVADEHRAIDRLLDQLIPRWRRIAATPADLPVLAGELGALAHSVWGLFEPHLSFEEEVLFAKLTSALSASARASILDEIRARRTPSIRAAMSTPVR